MTAEPDAVREAALAVLATVLDRALDGDPEAYGAIYGAFRDDLEVMVAVTERHALGIERQKRWNQHS